MPKIKIEPLTELEIATAVQIALRELRDGPQVRNCLIYRTLLHFRELSMQSLQAFEKLEKKYGVLEYPASAPRERSPYVRKPRGSPSRGPTSTDMLPP